jgi:hypothetical protein
MHLKQRSWHGYGEDWVPHFIHEYQIEISSQAWSGYQTQGKGMMICEVDCPRKGLIWDFKTARHHFSYTALMASIQHLERLELGKDEVSNLTQSLQTYQPDQEAIVLITGKGEILVAMMRNLALAEISKQHQSREAFSRQANPRFHSG